MKILTTVNYILLTLHKHSNLMQNNFHKTKADLENKIVIIIKCLLFNPLTAQ